MHKTLPVLQIHWGLHKGNRQLQPHLGIHKMDRNSFPNLKLRSYFHAPSCGRPKNPSYIAELFLFCLCLRHGVHVHHLYPLLEDEMVAWRDFYRGAPVLLELYNAELYSGCEVEERSLKISRPHELRGLGYIGIKWDICVCDWAFGFSTAGSLYGVLVKETFVQQKTRTICLAMIDFLKQDYFWLNFILLFNKK